MAVTLKDARIVVKLDTKAATAEAKKLRTGEGRQEERKSEREDKRKEKRREERQKEKEKSRLAVIPGFGRQAGRFFRVVKGILAIRAGEEVAGLAGGFFGEAGKDKFVEPATDLLSTLLTEASAAVTRLRTMLAAVVSVTGQTIGMAKAQQLLTGEVDFADLKEFATASANVQAMLAAVEARKKVVGREALGVIGAKGAEQIKNFVVEMVSEAHN